MNRKIRIIRKPLPGRTWVRACLAFFLAAIMILPALAQVNSYERYIFLSGQLTNTLTGAPIPDHNIYITSDSSLNNGFSYYAVAKTDANGFYLDTIVTTSSDGILKIHLFDLSNNILEIDRYYRFIWENTYLMFANFSIIDPNTTSDFQANFKTSGAFNQENPLKVLFRDLSIGNSIKSWEWDFGDGHQSEVQDPEHIYAKPGVYMVTLTVSSLPPEFEYFTKSSITKQVQVGLTEFSHLGGHVFAQYFPIDFGLAYLYALDEDDNLIPVDTTAIDTLGYYYFYQLPVGKYLTKARLDVKSELYGQFMPTYFGDVFNWYESETVILEENNFEVDIDLLPSSGMFNGSGQIIGQIIYDTTQSAGSIAPAGDIEIILLNYQGHSITCKLSDLEGYFTFPAIAYGTYQLFPDVAGTITAPMFVTISEDKPNADDVSLVILPEQVTFAIHESEYIGEAFLLYPNPVADQARMSLNIKRSSTVTLQITDLTGRIISHTDYRLPAGKNEVVIDTRQLPAGCYQVILMPEDRRAVSGKFLKYN